MIRAIGVFGMAGMFLFISPNLRYELSAEIEQTIKGLDQYSPFSYIGVGLALAALVMVYLRRSAAPR